MRRVLLALVLFSTVPLIVLGTLAAPRSDSVLATTPTRAVYAPLIAKPEPPTATVAPTATPVPTPRPLPGIANGGFEQGHVGWVEIPGNSIITQFGPVPPHTGQWEAWLGGGTGGTDEIQQQITLPAQAPIWLNYASQGDPNDTSGVPLFNVFFNTDILWTDYPLPTGWQQTSLNVSSYAGQTVTLRFRLVEGQSFPGGMAVDDVFLSR